MKQSMKTIIDMREQTRRRSHAARVAVVFGFGIACAFAGAGASAEEFPEGANTPNASELEALIKDKVFTSKQADGSSWRLDYRSNGYFYVNTSGGFKASGKWAVEDGKLCMNLKTDPTVCNDMRLQGTKLLLKRTNGSVISLEPA